jgi:hypothetical protein
MPSRFETKKSNPEEVAGRLHVVMNQPKRAWKNLKDLTPKEKEGFLNSPSEEGAVELSSDVLQEDMSDKAMKGLERLAKRDAEKDLIDGDTEYEVSDADVEILSTEPVDVTKDAISSEMDEELEILKAGDVIRDKKMKVAERIKDREDRISRLKKTTEDLKSSIPMIEAQSARRLEGIRRGSRANMATNAKAFEEEAVSMRESAHVLARAEALHVVEGENAQEEAEIESQIERNESGRIIGFKNIPKIRGVRAIFRVVASCAKDLSDRTISALNEPSQTKRNEVMKQSEEAFEKWKKMLDFANLIEETGGDTKNSLAHNWFYQPLEKISRNKPDVELAVMPEKDLRERLDRLNEQNVNITELLMTADGIFWETGKTVEMDGKQRGRFAEFIRGVRGYRESEVKEARRQIDLLHESEKSEHLDLRSRRLNIMIHYANEQLAQLRGELMETKGAESLKKKKDEMNALEGRVEVMQAKLEKWRTDPNREKEIDWRREEVQAKLAKLESELPAREQKVKELSDYESERDAPLKERMHQHQQNVETAWTTVYDLAVKKIEIVDEAYHISDELVDRQLEALEVTVEPIAFDVNLDELNQSAKEEDIDLTDLNESVHGYDIPVDISDFEEEDQSGIRQKKTEEKPVKKKKTA